MSQQPINFLDVNFLVDRELGALTDREAWWAERQEALERAGYMLRSRFRPSWKPSWKGTKKLYFRCEDGQIKVVCVDICAYCSIIYEFSCVWAWMQPGFQTEDL